MLIFSAHAPAAIVSWCPTRQGSLSLSPSATASFLRQAMSVPRRGGWWDVAGLLVGSCVKGLDLGSCESEPGGDLMPEGWRSWSAIVAAAQSIFFAGEMNESGGGTRTKQTKHAQKVGRPH